MTLGKDNRGRRVLKIRASEWEALLAGRPVEKPTTDAGGRAVLTLTLTRERPDRLPPATAD